MVQRCSLFCWENRTSVFLYVCSYRKEYNSLHMQGYTINILRFETVWSCTLYRNDSISSPGAYLPATVLRVGIY